MTQFRATLRQLSEKMINGRSGKLVALVFLLLSLLVIAQVTLANWDTLISYQWQFRPLWLFAVVIFFTIDLLIASWVWHLLIVRLANYNNYRRSTKICWYTNMARRIPTPIGYITGRILLYEQEGVSKITISLISALELAFFLLSGLITTLLTLPFWVIPPELELQRYTIFLLLSPLTILLVHPRILEQIWRKVSKHPIAQKLLWKDTISWLLIYILTWVFGAFVVYSLINLVVPLPLSKIIIIVGIWSLAGSISLAGNLAISLIGIRELSLTLLLAPLIPAPIAFVVAILVRITWLMGEFLSSLVSLKL